MAGLSSSGLGSGLDINSLVSQLVTAEKATQQAQITRAQTSTVTSISALATLKGAMATFNTALTPLKTVEVFSARSATSSDQEVFYASATNAAAPGVYDVQVEHLASAHQLSSDPFASGQSQVVGTGTLTIQVGSKSFSVAIDSSNDELGQIRDAINQAADNDDLVTATIINASDGAHLVLSSVASGEASAIQVSQSGGNGGLASLVYNPGLTTNYRELRAARDTEVYIGGERYESATNTISNAIDGVTVTLVDADPGEVKTLTIANDTAATVGRVKAFVDGFNALAKQIATLRSYDATTRKAGPLLGDSMLRAIEGELRGKLSDPVAGTGSYQTLANVGITTEKDGTLKLDNTKLTAAMTANFDGVARLFGSANGVAARLANALTPRLASDAELDLRTKRLNQKSLDLQKQQQALEARMAKVEARYRAQFTALDSLLSRMQNTSSYLTQQLSQIANIGSGGDR
jgi:flagellar hook-associated protein 2